MAIPWIHRTGFVPEWLIRILWFIVWIVSTLDIPKDFSEIWQSILGQNADIVDQAGYSAYSEAAESQLGMVSLIFGGIIRAAAEAK